ncbi:MAG: ATP-binding cassette domain-containing protein [Candidatus Freyarchaeota archaeon]|nr:ATP-binding cassette domain-containing protein [Candidatus Jordarchaeia archaeon]
MRSVVLEADDVWFTYPDGTQALKGVSFKVFEGETVVLLGPSGAGKSTVLLHFAGILFPSSGSVYVCGEKVSRRNVKEVRRHVGLVFQNPESQLFCPTVWDDVAFGPTSMGLPANEVERRVKRALEAVGILECAWKHPHHLSFGEKRRAALATVLSMSPDVYLFDEPTANLDPRNAFFVIEKIAELSGEGKTVLVATHDVDVLPQVASRVIIMSGGRVFSDGEPEKVLSDFKLIAEAGLRPPVITSFLHSLNEEGILNVDEPYSISQQKAKQKVKESIEKLLKPYLMKQT